MRKLIYHHKIQAIFYFLLTLIILRWEVVFNLQNGFLGGVTGDPGIYTYLAKANFKHSWFELNSFYPYNYSLGWSDTFIIPSLAIQSLNYLGFSFVVAYNLIILLSQFANGFTTYLLAKKYSQKHLSSLIAGLSLMSCQFLFAHMGHPQLQFFFFIPLGIYLLEKGLTESSNLALLATGIILPLAFLSCSYYGIFLALLLGIIIILNIKLNYYNLKKLYLCLPGLIILLPFILSYLKVQEAFGNRQLHEPQAFAASLGSYLSPANNSLLGQFLPSFSHGEAQLYIGIIGLLAIFSITYFFISNKLLLTSIVLILSLFTSYLAGYFKIISAISGILTCLLLLFYFIRSNSISSKLIFFVLFGFLISLGPEGIDKFGHHAYSLHRLFYEIFPGFSAIRAISRFGIITILFLTIYFAQTYTLSKRIFTILTIILLIEAVPKYLTIEKLPEAPQAVQELLSSNRLDSILILPFTGNLNSDGNIISWSEFANINVKYMNWFADSKLRLVNGYSGQRSNLMEQLPKKIINFPDQKSLAALKQYPGINYVVDLRLSSGEEPMISPIKVFADQSKIYEIQHSFKAGETFYLPSKTSSINYWSKQACEIEIFEVSESSLKKVVLNSGVNSLKIDFLSSRVAPYKLQFKSNCSQDYEFTILDVQ